MTVVHKFEDYPHNWEPLGNHHHGPWNILTPEGKVLRRRKVHKIWDYYFFDSVYDESLPRNHPDRHKAIGKKPSEKYTSNVEWEDGKYAYTQFKCEYVRDGLTRVTYGGPKLLISETRVEDPDARKIKIVRPFLEEGQLVLLSGTRDKARPYRILSSVDSSTVFGQKVGIKVSGIDAHLVGSSNSISHVDAIMDLDAAKQGRAVMLHDFRGL